jgi:hypothetical protein
MGYGSNLIQRAAPHHGMHHEELDFPGQRRGHDRPPEPPARHAVCLAESIHDVALQVAFERQILKPVFHLIGFRLWV